MAAFDANHRQVELNSRRTSSASTAHVACAVERLIRQAVPAGLMQDFVLELLHQEGRVLSSRPGSKWPKYVLCFASALGAAPRHAVPAAAAVELAVTAIDLIDNIIDDEVASAPSSVKFARAINASLVPLALGFTSVLAGQETLGAERAQRIAEIISKGTVECCAGQDDDLRLAGRPCVTEGEALAMTAQKSGSLLAMACEVGAAVGSQDPALLHVAHEFGFHCGIVAQLLNDLVGIDSESRQRGSDLRLRKKTLPIAYALECARQEGMQPILEWFDRPDAEHALNETQVARYMHQVGAAHFAWVIADSHRHHAFAALRRIRRLHPGIDTRPLRSLVPRISPRFG